MTSIDAHLIRRALVGHSLNGETATASEEFRGLLNHLSTLSPEHRSRALNGFLAGRADGEEIVTAVARADPDGPAPAGDPDGDEGDWSPPRPISLPPVEPYPDVVLPDLVSDFARRAAAAIGCPVDFLGLPALVVAGAAIGRSASLMLKPGYFVTASLYGMNVGGPTSGKSPALDAVARPMWEIDEALHDEYRRERAEFDSSEAAYAEVPKGAKPPRMARPVMRSALLEDTTADAIAPRLAANPRGLLIPRDEGSAWVAAFGQFKSGRGTDRQFFLSALFGKPIRVDRKGQEGMEPIRVPRPFLSVVGNMTPEMVGSLRESGGRADGFIERILFACPDPLPRSHWSEEGLPEEATADWSSIIHRLRARPMLVESEKERPNVVKFSPEAKALWVGWYNTQVDEANSPGANAGDLAAEGKLVDFAARIALILHLTNLACDPTRPDGEPIPPLSRWAVSGAIALWSYLRSHHRRARSMMGGAFGGADAQAVVDWIRRTTRSEFSVRQLCADLRWLRDRPDGPDPSLALLEARGIIRRRPEPERAKGRRGQKPSPTLEVNPHLLAATTSHTHTRNTQNTRNSGPGSNSGYSVYSGYAPENVVDSMPEGETRGGDEENHGNTEEGAS